MGFRSFAHQLFARQSQETGNPDPWRLSYNRRALSGVVITPDTAPTVAAVWACLRYLSQTVAMLPWRVMRDSPNGGELAATHRVDYLLYQRPNPEWSSFQFRETLLHWALRGGNGYAEIERDSLGRPVGMWPLHWSRVQPRRNDDGELIYRVYANEGGGGGFDDFDKMDIFHVRGFGEGPVGVNVMAYAAESIGWAKAAQLFGAAFFGNGMNISAIVEANASLDAPARKRLRAALDSLYRGPKNAGRYAILDAGQKYTPVQIDPEKGQFIATNEYLVAEIARWFGVPPHKIADLTRGTFSNIEQQSIEVVVDSILPWTMRFQQEADYKLFGIQNRQNFYTRMNLTTLLRGDVAARTNYYQVLSQRGVFTINDILRSEDLNTIGPEGDERLIQSQNVTLKSIIDGSAQQPAVPASAPGNPNPNETVPAVDMGVAELFALAEVFAPESTDA